MSLPVMRAALVLAVVVLGAAAVVVNSPIRFPLDDAYITLANARLLIEGGTDGFGQDRPTGATSPIHLLALAVLGRAMPLPVANLALALAGVGVLAAGMWRLARGLGAGPGTAAAVALAALTAGAAWFQMLNGLETGLAMAALAWVAVGLTGPGGRWRDAGLAALLGALPFLRPELAALSVTGALALGWRLRRQPGALARVAGAAGGTALVLAVLGWAATGRLLPTTAGAKTAFFADAAAPLAVKLAAVGQFLVVNPIALPLLGLVFLPLVRGGWALLGFVVAFLGAATLTLPSGLVHNEFRYLHALLPLGLAGWVVLGRVGRLGWLAAPVVALAAIAPFPLQGWPVWRDALAVTDDQERLAVWAEANLPAEARVLIHDAGYFAWRTRFALVDVVGLKTPEAVRWHRALTLPSAGLRRAEAVGAIAREGAVTHAIILERPFWRDLAGDLASQGWQLAPLRPVVPGVLYQIYALTPPEG